MSITINPYRIDRASVDMAETANSLRLAANAAPGLHAYQNGGTYGAATDTQVKALAIGIVNESKVSLADATDVARRIVDECVDNGENVGYQLREVFHPDSPYVTGWGTGGIAVVVVDDHTCDCGDPACGCGCIPGNYLCEHGTVGEGCAS